MDRGMMGLSSSEAAGDYCMHMVHEMHVYISPEGEVLRKVTAIHEIAPDNRSDERGIATRYFS